jgi:hypothetical protein
MKRIILGTLALLGAWQLIQLPAVNAALFAFLALGINPVTNHPFSTPSLISILFTLGIVSLILFFSRALGDFFGGLFDWLTHVNHAYGVVNGEAADRAEHLSLASLPVHPALDNLAEPVPISAAMAVGGAVATLRALPIPTFGMERIHPYVTWLEEHYRLLIAQAKHRLQTDREPKAGQQSKEAESAPSSASHTNIAPELAEVVAIFERLAQGDEALEPQEAVIVEPSMPRQPSVFIAVLRQQFMRLRTMLGLGEQAVLRDARRASAQASLLARAAEQHTNVAAKKTEELATRAARAAYYGFYRTVLLVALGLLLGGGVALQALHMILHAISRAASSTYRRSCRALIICSVTITLGMFAAGRGVLALIRAAGRGLTALCRSVYRVLSLSAIVSLISAGYLLYIFSLACFIVWEILEPYARKLDKVLGDTVDSKEGLLEISKVGREMSRTFAQWYHEVRQILHSTSD